MSSKLLVSIFNDVIGQMPRELRCTVLGGLSITPAAQALKPGCGGFRCSTC